SSDVCSSDLDRQLRDRGTEPRRGDGDLVVSRREIEPVVTTRGVGHGFRRGRGGDVLRRDAGAWDGLAGGIGDGSGEHCGGDLRLQRNRQEDQDEDYSRSRAKSCRLRIHSSSPDIRPAVVPGTRRCPDAQIAPPGGPPEGARISWRRRNGSGDYRPATKTETGRGAAPGWSSLVGWRVYRRLRARTTEPHRRRCRRAVYCRE